MKSILKNKKGQTGIQQLPGFFQVIMLIIIIVGLTFIVLDKFISITESSSQLTSATEANETVTGLAEAGDTLTESNRYFFSLTSGNSSTIVVNATGYWGSNESIDYDGNWSVTVPGVILGIASSPYLGTDVNVTYTYRYIANPVAHKSINESTWDLYNYGVAFLGVIILVVMVYLIISIISGKGPGRKGAR